MSAATAPPSRVESVRVGGNLPSLTGLRWCAALAVFAVHSGVSSPTWLVDITLTGVSAVSFFFILSGVVMAWSAQEQDSLRSFYVRRVARIVPLYLAVWFIAGVLSALAAGSFNMQAYLAGVPMLQSWINDKSYYFGANGPAWSISTEAFFYLLCPVLLALLHRLRSALLALSCVILGIAVAVVDVVAQNVASTSELLTTGGTWAWFAYIFPPVRCLEFAVGCCLGLLMRRSLSAPVSLPAASVITVATLLAVSHLVDPHVAAWITLGPFCLLILAASRRDLDGAGSWLGSPWMVRFGQWSFAFYLVHTQVINAVALLRQHGAVTESIDRFAVLAPVELLLSIAAAAALHYAIERPLERRIRKQVSSTRLLPVSG